MPTEEPKPELKRENSIAFSVYTGYGQAGRDKLKDIKKTAAETHRSVSNFVMYLYERYKK